MADSSKIRAKAEPRVDVSTVPDSGMCNSAILDKAVEIAGKRREVLSDMRRAVQRDDRELVFALAKKLTGLSDETSHRADQSIN